MRISKWLRYFQVHVTFYYYVAETCSFFFPFVFFFLLLQKCSFSKMYWVIEACPNAVRLAWLVYIADTQLYITKGICCCLGELTFSKLIWNKYVKNNTQILMKWHCNHCLMVSESFEMWTNEFSCKKWMDVILIY